jgi:hypothetical protein
LVAGLGFEFKELHDAVERIEARLDALAKVESDIAPDVLPPQSVPSSERIDRPRRAHKLKKRKRKRKREGNWLAGRAPLFP